jgi:hypothetical protein
MEKFTVVKSVSLDVDLLNRVRNESEIMSKSFSESISILLRIGLSVREDQRNRDEAELKTLNKGG